MAAQVEAQLDSQLQALQALKPPGASKGKIAAITTLCIDNIQHCATLVEKLARHFHATPASHKLGVLFVVDSVTRQWIERAKLAGQPLTPAGPKPAGTFSSGVHNMSDKITILVAEMIKKGPSDQKAKVQNLVDIWRRGNTFPYKIGELESICKQSAKSHVVSRTPPGSPPRVLIESLGLSKTSSSRHTQRPVTTSQPSGPAPPTDAASILAALANLGKGPQFGHGHVAAPATAQPFGAGPSAPSQDVATLLGSLGTTPLPLQQYATPLPISTPFSQPLPTGGFVPNGNYGVPVPHSPAPGPPAGLSALTSMIPPHILSDPVKLTQVLTLFQDLIKAGIPQDQWGPVVAQLYPQGQQPQQPVTPAWQQTAPMPNGRAALYDQPRQRSRSPAKLNRRGSPVYGTYGGGTSNGGHDGENGRTRERSTGRGYRQRSPLNSRNADSGHGNAKPQKWTEIDRSVPHGRIKVLSRTLFVGGATGSEADLRQIFGKYGDVQTCIVNNEKRHAFVKMCTREGAVRAREGMENMRDPDVLAKARQTKWGVGFGPRDCCDYTTGESTIPIDRLTDADHKWVLTAEFGGSGGRPIESGLVMEEPDIEIGAGVSSKAMSRRVGPEVGGGKRGRHDRGGGGGAGRHRQQDQRYESPREEPANVQPPPQVPNFGFQYTMPGSSAPRY